jgi:cystathionine beta-lyase/cystathionine gamma-synthase
MSCWDYRSRARELRITDDLVRLACGIGDQRLIAGLEQALEAV